MAHADMMVCDLERQLAEMETEKRDLEKMYQEKAAEHDALKKLIFETIKATQIGDLIFGEALLDPDEQCHTIEEYIKKAGQMIKAVCDENEKLKEESDIE